MKTACLSFGALDKRFMYISIGIATILSAIVIASISKDEEVAIAQDLPSQGYDLNYNLEHANAISASFKENKEVVKTKVDKNLQEAKVHFEKQNQRLDYLDEEDYFKAYIQYKERNKLIDRNIAADTPTDCFDTDTEQENLGSLFAHSSKAKTSDKAGKSSNASLSGFDEATLNQKRQAYYEALKAKTKVELNSNRQNQEKGSQSSITTAAATTTDLKANNQYNPMKAYEILENEDTVLQNKVVSPKTPYALMQGSVISATLSTSINSHLPGQVTARVNQDIFDSIKGRHLLIPVGSKLVGQYDSRYAFGTYRLFIGFNRIIFPNGNSLNLGAMPGQSLDGKAGFDAQVETNYFQAILNSFLLSSIQTQNDAINSHYSNLDSTNTADTMTKNFINQNQQTLPEIIQNGNNVTTTLNVSSGYNFTVAITKDIFFESPYGAIHHDYYIQRN